MAVEVDLLNANSINNINTNFERVEASLQDAISRSGDGPNQMNADLDLNGNDLLNVGSVNADVIFLNGEVIIPTNLGSLPSNSVGTPQIIDDSVTNDKMADDSVGTNELIDNSVTNDKMANNSINTAELIDSAVTTPKVNDGAITEPKLNFALTLTLPSSAYTLAQIRAIDTSRYVLAYYAEDGREGMFKWSADISSLLMGVNIVSSSVNDNTETITSTGHGLVTGEAVLVSSAVNGLTTNTIYYVFRVDANNFRLASSFLNAKAGTPVNLIGTSAITVRRHKDPLSGMYITPTTDLSGASGGWIRQGQFDGYNVKWFGAKGDHVTDDVAAIQATVFFAEVSSLRKVIIPAHVAGGSYRVSREILIQRPIRIEGEHPTVTIGNMASGLVDGQYMFKIDGTIFPNLEQVAIRNISLRLELGGTRCRGILLDRVAYVTLEDVIISNGTIGILMTNDRGYANNFIRLRINGCTGEGFYVNGFTGGGQHLFEGCAFNGNAIGFSQTSTSRMNGVVFDTCAWETNVQAFISTGDLYGCVFNGCYSEKNSSAAGYTLGFIPAASKVVEGLVINGGFWETDVQSYPFLLGGSGEVRNFIIQGCSTDGYSTALVRGNGTVRGGVIQGNYLQSMTAVVSNGPLTRVTIQNNENSSGAVS